MRISKIFGLELMNIKQICLPINFFFFLMKAEEKNRKKERFPAVMDLSYYFLGYLNININYSSLISANIFYKIIQIVCAL